MSKSIRESVFAALGALFLTLLAAGCRPQAPATPTAAPYSLRPAEPTLHLPDAFFEDVTAGSGIDFTYRNGEEADQYTMLETLGGGVALLDYDGDGRLDVFLPGGGSFEGPHKKQIKGRPCKLYRNLGGGKFQDVTEAAGLAGISFYTHGAAVADYDRDGWPDLLVTGYGRLALFHNEPDGKGGRRFVDVTEKAGLAGGPFWGTNAAWGDVDGDGYPDLYVCQYVNWSWDNNPHCPGAAADVPRDTCTPRLFEARPHALFLNTGPDGGPRRFRDVTREAGLRAAGRADKDYGKGLGVLMVDVNGDGKPDLYVANDTTDNFLYLNESTPGKPAFREVGLPLGVARDGSGKPDGSMGTDAADYDGRGVPSLFVTNYEGELHGLYRNMTAEGRQFFLFATPSSGVAAIGQEYVGFGTAFLDLDNDGWEDLVISNGHVLRHPARSPLRQKPVLLYNLGTGQFRPVTRHGGAYFAEAHRGRGLAVGDLDNDGRSDLVLSPVNEPATVLRNVAPTDNHWLGVELVGQGHRDVVGARLTVEAGGRRLVRFARGGGSYLSSGDRRLLVGLGTAERVGRVTVEWPSGTPRVQQWHALAIDRYHRLCQGRGEGTGE